MGYYALCPILGVNMLKYKNKKLIFRIILLVLMDMLIITAAGPLAIYVRYNLFFEPQAIEFIENIFKYLPVNLILTVTVFAAFRLYQGIWKYASASDLVNIILACLVSAVTQTIGMMLMGLRFPRSYPFMYICCADSGNFYIPIYLSDPCLFTTEAAGADQGRQDQYHDRGGR